MTAAPESIAKTIAGELARRIDAMRVAWWETMAHVRWAVIGCQQAERYTVGGEQSLELALTAHVVPELELEVLRLTAEAA